VKKYIWLEPGEKALVNGYDGIFIGNEVCGEFLSPTGLDDFIDELNFYGAAGHNVGIIAPYLTPEREINFIALLKKLSRPTEIAANDVGAFRLIEKSGHIPVLGRLLTKQNTDPAIISFYQKQPDRIVYDVIEPVRLIHADPPKELTEHFKGSPVFSKEAANLFLGGREEITVMMDMPPHGIPDEIPERYRVMLNIDDILVSVLPCRSCENCPKKEIFLGKTRADVAIYRKRNLCYYKLSDAPVLNENSSRTINHMYKNHGNS